MASTLIRKMLSPIASDLSFGSTHLKIAQKILIHSFPISKKNTILSVTRDQLLSLPFFIKNYFYTDLYDTSMLPIRPLLSNSLIAAFTPRNVINIAKQPSLQVPTLSTAIGSLMQAQLDTVPFTSSPLQPA